MIPTTIKELLYWSYANLCMAQVAIVNNMQKYGKLNFSIRAKLYKGLMNGTMNVRSLFDDEKEKMRNGYKCVYCGTSENLCIDHIFAKSVLGSDCANNLVCACFPPVNCIRKII